MRKNSTGQKPKRKISGAGLEIVEDKTPSVIFFFACITNILINLDHGIIPACTKEVMEDLNIGEVDLGLLGSLVYAGLIMGSITGTVAFNKYAAKKIIILAGIGNICSLVIFPLTKNMFLLSFSRVATGFFQVFFCIYFPVWVDLHGKEKRTKWLTLLQVSVPLGIFLGYAITAFFVNFWHWTYAFFTQTAMLIGCVLSFLFFSEESLSTGAVTGDSNATLDLGSDDQYLPAVTTSAFLAGETNEDYTLADTSPTSLNESEEDQLGSPSKKPRPGIRRNLRILWKNQIYRYSMLALTSLFFVVTGIQFWISDYWRSVLGIEKETVFMTFAGLIVTAPTLGVIVGGYITDRLGGYTSKEALDFVCIFGILSACSGVPIPFLNNFPILCGFLWLELFFGGGMMPAITGIMISSVPKNMRAMGNSIAQLCSNAFGYFPSPFIYGFVINQTGGETSRYGMMLLMAWAFFGVIAGYLARRAKRKVVLTVGDISALGLM